MADQDTATLADVMPEEIAPVATPPMEQPEERVRKLDEHGRAYATGRRKNAVARVWITAGNGKLTVNGREGNVYFARPVLQMILNHLE